MVTESISDKIERLREDLMARINWHKTIVILAGCVFVALLSVFLRWTKIPPPKITVHPISADQGFETVTIGTTTTTSESYTRTRLYRHEPEKLDFESTNGPVDVCIAPIVLAYSWKSSEHIRSLKQEFAEGKIPKTVVDQCSGTSGRIWLNHSTNDGRAYKSFLVMIRSPTENQVTLKVHYGYGHR